MVTTVLEPETAVQEALGVLPKQTVNLSVPDPKATPQLSMPLYQGAGYRPDFKTWSLLNNGGFMLFRLYLPETIPVDLTLSACAALVGGQANCPITVTVNDQVFVKSYSDHNANFHDVKWTIPAGLLRAGNNDIRIALDMSASTQLFINAITVDQAVLATQTVDLSVPDPSQTSQLSMPLYYGAGYRADFKTWSILRSGGFMRFNLSLGNTIPVTFTLSLAAALVQGKANCPLSIAVNGWSLVSGYNDTDANFHKKSWTIPQDRLHTGDNTIQVTLDLSATTQIFINAVTVSGE